MNPRQPAPPSAPLIKLDDIYYTLFRHKWLIAILAALTLAVAVTYWVLYPVSYESHAELLVKYIQNTKPLQQSGSDAQVIQMQVEEDSIINAEIAILTSFDVATNVAGQIGPAKILAKIDHGTNLIEAANVILNGLSVPSGRRSDIIFASFSHPDRDIVQPVLDVLIDAYNREHEIVRRPHVGDKLDEEIDRLRSSIQTADDALARERTNAGILSLADSETSVASQIGKVESQISDVQIELGVKSFVITHMKKTLGSSPSLAPDPATNAVAASTSPPQVAPGVADEYQRLIAALANQRNREQQLLTWATTNFPEVKDTEIGIATTESAITQMEQKYPALIAIKPSLTPAGEPNRAASDPMAALNAEINEAMALGAKLQILTNQLAQAEAKAGVIDAHEGPIMEAQHDADLSRSSLRYYQERREEAKADEIVGPQNSSIFEVEQPTPPMGDFGKARKGSYAILTVGLLLALGLPFLIEFYLDQSLKRPSDVQSHLNLPFFLSMPKLELNGKIKALKGRNVPLLTDGETTAASKSDPVPATQSNGAANGTVAPWDEQHALHPFFETLRDRLMTYFEMINLTHKPKLVAVTSCDIGAGVTTTAAGLAASLSETGDGNVLLVNMHERDGEAQHFYKGKLACGLEEALEKTTRDTALVQNHLYIAKNEEGDDTLPRVLPKRFSHLVGKMKASDYDYIIFDMPPISQISITPRLARFMDMVLLVVESEKTSRDVAKRAGHLLTESKTNVGVVLNKQRTYVPRRLQQEI